MADVRKVVVWSKEGCRFCQEVKNYLSERQIDFEDINVTNNDSLRDVLEVKYGIRHVPVVEIQRENNVYDAVTEVGIVHLKEALL